ncbi:MAG TPA: TadE family protein [Bryobacteraceae bacterium]|nr:TadE family protein [Bryobacteraceae bacterium]
MNNRKKSRYGNATLEFTLIGIPLMFVLISTFEMARGMWLYHTMAYAVKEGARYTITRGQNSPAANQLPMSAICGYVVKQGPGLIAHNLTLTFTSFGGASGPYLADACPGTKWPPGGVDGSGNPILDNQPGQAITITARYPFQSTIVLFWPGVKGGGMTFPTVTFPAAASEVMQF